MELCARIDQARRRWDVLKHPFYERWECGELTRDELANLMTAWRERAPAVSRLSRQPSLGGPATAIRMSAGRGWVAGGRASGLVAMLMREYRGT